MENQGQYFSEYGEVLLYFIGGTVFVALGLLTSRLIRPHRPNDQKLSTYETGEEAISSAWAQFNIRFYFIALMFLVFEVEILFLFPWALVFSDKALIEETQGLWGWFALAEMLVFVFVLAIGLVYAWANGLLDWVKPEPKPEPFESPVPEDLYEKINAKY